MTPSVGSGVAHGVVGIANTVVSVGKVLAIATVTVSVATSTVSVAKVVSAFAYMRSLVSHLTVLFVAIVPPLGSSMKTGAHVPACTSLAAHEFGLMAMSAAASAMVVSTTTGASGVSGEGITCGASIPYTTS